MNAYHELTAMAKLKDNLEKRMVSIKSNPQTKGGKLTIIKIKEGLKWIEFETKRLKAEQKKQDKTKNNSEKEPQEESLEESFLNDNCDENSLSLDF